MTTAILTKYHGPTNTRGARVSASWGADRAVVEYDSTDGMGRFAHFSPFRAGRWCTHGFAGPNA